MKRWMIVSSICALTFVACDKNDDNKVNDADRTFVNMASISNNTEIMTGQLAATRATDSTVKAFAQQMVNEHTLAQMDLKDRASGNGLAAHDSVDAEHQMLMTTLGSLIGHSFDTAYINSQVRDHAKTLDIFNAEITGGKNQGIRSYANEYQPHIQMHFNTADSIQRSL